MDFELIKDGEGRDAFFSYAREKARLRAETDPDIGDMVHFWDGERCRAAVITEDNLYTFGLSFLVPGELNWRPVREALHDETKAENTWHWPCGGN